LAVVGWAIMRSKRTDPESQQLVEAVAKASGD
jgi:hypothetical protein